MQAGGLSGLRCPLWSLVTVMGYLLQDTQSACTTGGSAIYDKGAVFLGSLWTTTQPIEAKVAKHFKTFRIPPHPNGFG